MSAAEYERFVGIFGGPPSNQIMAAATSSSSKCGRRTQAKVRAESFYALTSIRSSIRSRRNDACLTANNAVCDEPAKCAAGTDDTDCGARTCKGDDSCSLAKNGVCNSPNTCPTGTDVADCCGKKVFDDSCTTANNGLCEEPTSCQAGTDTSDCGGASSDGGISEADFVKVIAAQNSTSTCEWRFKR
jgi:hypothetical protein